jgi:ubiquinone biosynthesis accessory factor UbiJ
MDLEKLILPALNHLLQGASWAQVRLKPLSGSKLRVVFGAVILNIQITEDGLFAQGDDSQIADVLITLPDDAVLKFISDRGTIFSSVKLSGSVDVAESLAFVFRNLRWDIEGDLASVLGDIPARRIAVFGGQIADQMQDGIIRICDNAVEFLTEDSSMVVPLRDIQTFGKAVDNLRDDLARLEKRFLQL